MKIKNNSVNTWQKYKKKILVLVIFMILIFSNSCSKKSYDLNNETEIIIEENKKDISTFSDYVKNSLINIGNNNRMSNVIKKIENGEKIKVAYLGGSITEGYKVSKKQNYATQTTAHLRTIFKNEDISTINAGLSGTSSTIGLLRSNHDILIEKPDLIVIEFAVNDSQDLLSQYAYDSLVKQCLEQDNQPAIILLFTMLENGYSCEEQMEKIGKAYDLPMISIKELLQPQIENKELTWNDYALDDAHPSYKGHKMIAECMQYYFLYIKSCVDNGSIDKEIDYTEISSYGAPYYEMLFYNSLNFKPESIGGYLIGSSNIEHFPNGWVWNKSESGIEAMKFTITAKNLFLLYKEDHNMNLGNMEIYVDGIYKQTILGNSKNGWNNPQVAMILNLQNVETHEIEIKPEAGSEEKIFHILGIGTSGELKGAFLPSEESDETSITLEERAILNVGNTARIEKVLEKANHGEKIIIGFIGGSITQGTGASKYENSYASLVYQWFQKEYPETEIEMVNAGIGATTSQFACARVQEDLLDKIPDFIVVEFSVNDENNNVFRESYESLIRKILLSKENPAVLVFHMVQYDNGNSAQGIHKEIAQYYNLPEISMKESVYKEIQLKNLLASDISQDMLHPNDKGHKYAADLITYYLKKIKTGEYPKMEEESIKEPSMELTSDHAIRFNNQNANPDINGFTKDNAEQLAISDVFKNGWTATEVGSKIVFELTGSKFSILFRKSNELNVPMAVAIIDGDEENPITIDGNYINGWGNWLYYQDIYEGNEELHQIEIRLTTSDTNPFYLVSVISR